MELMDRLMAERKRTLAYNERRRRAGDDSPSRRWNGSGNSPSFPNPPDGSILKS